MLEAQYLSMVALGFGGFIFGMMPLKLSTKAKKSNPLFLSMLVCLGGGVLLATSLVHMLPEVQEKLQNLAELYFCAGFFLLYAVDELTHYCLGDAIASQHVSHEVRRKISTGCNELFSQGSSSLTDTKYGTIPKLQQKKYIDRRNSYSGDSANDYWDRFSSSDYMRLRTEGIGVPDLDQSCCEKHNHQKGYYKRVGAKPNFSHSDEVLSVKPSTSTVEGEDHPCRDHQHQSACHMELGEPCPENSVGVVGLIIALLIHSILEGTSIGVQTDSSQILLVLGAVSCHKLIISFCLGVELSSAGYKSFSFVAAIIVYSVGSPIGIALGMSLTSYAWGLQSVEAPLQATAAGSLLYVAAFEVMPRERFKWQHRDDKKAAGLFQLISVVIGFLCITLISMFVVSEGDYFHRTTANSSAT